jgi:hypothetical protein
MNDKGSTELGRILDMIESGKVSPEDGERLIGSLESRAQTMTCPYCVENIPAGTAVCPECATPLAAAPSTSASGDAPFGGYRSLSGGGKFLVVYTFVVCAIVLLTSLGWGLSGREIAPCLLAGLGVVSGILLCKGKPAGWPLAILWGALQIVLVMVNGAPLNRQVFHVGMSQTTNGSGLGLNLVGVALVIIAVMARRKVAEPVSG